MQVNFFTVRAMAEANPTEDCIYLACEAANTSANSNGRIQQIIAVAQYDIQQSRYDIIQSIPFSVQANQNNIKLMMVYRSQHNNQANNIGYEELYDVIPYDVGAYFLGNISISALHNIE